MTVLDRNDIFGQVSIRKYASDMLLMDCEAPVRNYVKQRYAKDIAGWMNAHPSCTEATFGQLGVTLWKASYTDQRIGRHKTVYSSSFESVVAKLSAWIMMCALGHGTNKDKGVR